MKTILIYLALTILLNVAAFVSGRYFSYVQNIIKESIVFVSLPTSKGLNTLQKYINEYLVLISVQQENKQLKQKLAEYMMLCKIDKNRKEYKQISKNMNEASFSFKGNFDSTIIYLHTLKELDLNKNYCFVLSDNLQLIGMVKKRIRNNVFKAITVFNPLFVADVMVKSNDNSTYKALFIGDEYSPRVEFLDPNISLNPNDKVYTSGDMGIFPPDLYIGTIKRTESVNGYYKLAIVDIKRSFFNRWKVIVFCRKKH